jgi:hypothetical protein
MKKIIFSTPYVIQPEYYPTPASKNLPEWYKEMSSYSDNVRKPNGQGSTTATIKKCLPVFDMMTAGYILYTPADIYVSQDETSYNYEWADLELISFHSTIQTTTPTNLKHPQIKNEFDSPKFRNPWAIKTPKGYSCLFMQPTHRDSVFNILPGVVDTDSYYSPVNFPFRTNDLQFTGLIPAGTPMAQVIPFKRDAWQMEFGELDVKSIDTRLDTKFFDKYKSMFWQKKEYK